MNIHKKSANERAFQGARCLMCDFDHQNIGVHR